MLPGRLYRQSRDSTKREKAANTKRGMDIDYLDIRSQS